MNPNATLKSLDWESDYKVAAEARTLPPSACDEFGFSCPACGRVQTRKPTLFTTQPSNLRDTCEIRPFSEMPHKFITLSAPRLVSSVITIPGTKYLRTGFERA
jgi:hypothetical protein